MTEYSGEDSRDLFGSEKGSADIDVGEETFSSAFTNMKTQNKARNMAMSKFTGIS